MNRREFLMTTAAASAYALAPASAAAEFMPPVPLDGFMPEVRPPSPTAVAWKAFWDYGGPKPVEVDWFFDDDGDVVIVEPTAEDGADV